MTDELHEADAEGMETMSDWCHCDSRPDPLMVEADQRIAAKWARSPQDRDTLNILLSQIIMKAYQRGYDNAEGAWRRPTP